MDHQHRRAGGSRAVLVAPCAVSNAPDPSSPDDVARHHRNRAAIHGAKFRELPTPYGRSGGLGMATTCQQQCSGEWSRGYLSGGAAASFAGDRAWAGPDRCAGHDVCPIAGIRARSWRRIFRGRARSQPGGLGPYASKRADAAIGCSDCRSQWDWPFLSHNPDQALRLVLAFRGGTSITDDSRTWHACRRVSATS